MDASANAAPLRPSVAVAPSTTASSPDWWHQPQLHARLGRTADSGEALLLLVEAAAAAGERPASRRALLALLLDLITRLDHQFNQQLNAILHHPRFRRLVGVARTGLPTSGGTSRDPLTRDERVGSRCWR